MRASEIKGRARELGFDACGIAPAAALATSKSVP